METPRGAGSFLTSGEAYDGFMGRYSRPLSTAFADTAGLAPGRPVLDAGCGPGALTGVLVDRVGADLVSAFDPSPTFVAACAQRHPGVDVRAGRAEDMPFADRSMEAVLAQLVLHFVTDPVQAGHEFRRVLRPGGTAAACVWDFAEGMQMLRLFWDAALVLDPDAPDEARALRFGKEGEITDWLRAAGFVETVETTITVESAYDSFDQLWAGFLAGIGPAGSYLVALPEDHRAALREELFRRAGSPPAGFTLTAVARSATGHAPG